MPQHRPTQEPKDSPLAFVGFVCFVKQARSPVFLPCPSTVVASPGKCHLTFIFAFLHHDFLGFYLHRKLCSLFFFCLPLQLQTICCFFFLHFFYLLPIANVCGGGSFSPSPLVLLSCHTIQLFFIFLFCLLKSLSGNYNNKYGYNNSSESRINLHAAIATHPHPHRAISLAR